MARNASRVYCRVTSEFPCVCPGAALVQILSHTFLIMGWSIRAFIVLAMHRTCGKVWCPPLKPHTDHTDRWARRNCLMGISVHHDLISLSTVQITLHLVGHTTLLYQGHWGQPHEATVVKMAPTRPLASRSFCLLVLLCHHRSLWNLQQRNTKAWHTLHQNDRLVSVLVFVQWSPKDWPRDDGRQICPK